MKSQVFSGFDDNLSMNSIKIIFMMIITLQLNLSWGASTFKLNAGTKELLLQSSDSEWNEFCRGEKFGCARFKTRTGKDKNNFGFIKALPEQSNFTSLNKFCTDLFSESKLIDQELFGFSAPTENIQACSWSSKTDTTIVILKDSIIFLVTISDVTQKSAIITMMNKAKFYEKR